MQCPIWKYCLYLTYLLILNLGQSQEYQAERLNQLCMFWVDDVGQNMQKKPIHTQGEQANSTQQCSTHRLGILDLVLLRQERKQEQLTMFLCLHFYLKQMFIITQP